MEAKTTVADVDFEKWPWVEEMKDVDWRALTQGPHLVYLLAHARREAFYIDVATNAGGIEAAWSRIVQQQQSSLPESQWRSPYLVWFERADDEASAQARAAHIRTLPHAWQRRMVDMINPLWMDLHGCSLGLPLEYMPVVGERCVASFTHR